jgi:PAS domain S-box-containing protein
MPPVEFDAAPHLRWDRCYDMVDRPPGSESSVPVATAQLDVDTFRLLVESVTDYAIFVLDPKGRIATWNTGAERIKGYRADEIIGRHFSTFYTADAVEAGWPDHELREAERVGRFEDEGWRVRKDGTRFWANVSITALRGPDGTLRGFAKVTRDLTQRKAHEERISALTRELQQRIAELAAANSELAHRNVENESFVYSVSHDLRSPLVNLQGFSQELSFTSESLQKVLASPGVPAAVRQSADELLTGEMQESIGFIRNAVRHLGNIIDGLLRLARVGRVEYESSPVDLNVVVAEIVAAMHTSVVEANARVVTASLPVISGDKNAIGQVFANLIGNALKNLDPTRPGTIEIGANREQPPVMFIRDNGVGIPAAYHSKIFQVFQHVHGTRQAGEGLGLAIVRRIVERHGGRIWFESRVGHGTTFYFTFGPPVAGAANEGH